MTNEDMASRRESGLLTKICETIQLESPKVLCVERHVRNEYGRAPLMDETQETCKYGKERENATKCSDCPYGVPFLEPRLVNDTHEVLRQLREIQRRNTAYIR